MAQLLAAPYSYFADANGAPLAGGLVYTYAAGSTTPKATYTDSGAGTPLANPVVLDSAGRASIWLVGSYQIVVKDSLGNTIHTDDNVTQMGDMSKSVYDAAAVNEQLLGLTATQTFTNKSTSTTATANTASTAVANMTAVQNSLTGGFVNKFINPCMDVQQMGTGATITAGSPAYTTDGWIVSCTGGNIPWVSGGAFIAGVGQTSAIRLQGAASVTDTLIKQRIEGLEAGRLAGQTVTFQCSMFNNNTGASVTPTITVKHATALDNWGATTTDVNAVSLQPVANSSTGTLAYTFSASSSAGNGLEITVDFGATLNNSSKFIHLTNFDIRATPGVAIGLNSAPPAPETRPIWVELPLCQRYLRKSFPQATAPAQNAGVAGAVTTKNPIAAGDPSVWVSFNPPMRAAPTITTYNPSATNANWRDITATADVTVSVDPSTTKGDSGFIIATSGTVASLGDILAIHYLADARL